MEKGVPLQFQPQLKHFIPINTCTNSKNCTLFSVFKFQVCKSIKNLYQKSKGFGSKRFDFDGVVVENSVFLDDKMEVLTEKSDGAEGKVEFCEENDIKIESFVYEEEGIESSLSSDFLVSEGTVNDEEHSSSEDSYSPPSIVWHVQKNASSEGVEKPHVDKRKLEKQGSCLSATLFGQIWRLEPLPTEKRLMWRREMEWLLCVSDYIVELTPSWQTFPDGTKLEVMTSRPRLDLYANLPALRKLDNMLLEILDSFSKTEFWYVDQGLLAEEADGSSSFRNPLPRQEEKWWLPVPRVPIDGLSENAKKQLQHIRDCTNQIFKAVMAINSNTLADMEVPESYVENLPKNGKASLGDLIHRYITSDQFSPECLLDCLDLSSEHQALEIANRVEASIYVWRRRTQAKSSLLRSNSKSSWEMVKDLMIDVDKRDLLADRAESLLLCLRQRFPGLPQTTLDMSKIQHNKDVGKSILESYSRVLESLAFNIVARIDDLIYVDNLTKLSDQFVPISKVGIISHKTIGTPISVHISGSQIKAPFTTPISSSHHISPAKGDRSQFLDNNKTSQFGFGVKKMLTDYWSVDSNGKDISNKLKRSDSATASVGSSSECSREIVSPSTHDLLREA